MTSLKESVMQAVPRPTPDTQWGSIRRTHTYLDEWAEGYIHELEQHMNRMKAYYPKVLLQWDDAVREVLRYLQGTTA